MLSVSDELKGDIAKYDALIADAEAVRTRKRKSLELLEGHIDQLHVQRMAAEGRLERAEARLVRPTGKCVTLESNGVEWKV
jgi:hypothetical protein